MRKGKEVIWMIVYSIILLAAAAALIVVGVLVYSGKTQLIHQYHRTRVKDMKAYGKAMGKALCLISVPLTAVGVLALFTDSAWLTLILVVGLAVSLVPLFIVQKKYNGGVL